MKLISIIIIIALLLSAVICDGHKGWGKYAYKVKVKHGGWGHKDHGWTKIKDTHDKKTHGWHGKHHHGWKG